MNNNLELYTRKIKKEELHGNKYIWRKFHLI